MIFASYGFIFLFLPLVLFIYFLLSKKFSLKVQHIFLIFASLFFYGYFNPTYLLIILSSIVVNYSLALLIQKQHRSKLFLISGIIFNIGLLGYFKYYNFFVENINFVFQQDWTLKNILLPLGISFFTFQQFSFLLSVYKKEEKIENLIDYSLFVLFFPQLVAGPIVLYREMIPQFRDKTKRYINYDNVAKGIYLFVLGLFKKIVIADTLAIFVKHSFDGSVELGFLSAWMASLSYTLQIYFDFSGYADMAIGIAKMFNINLPNNFNSPYRSASIGEFWRRWHITLGRALSTYIYIPLGGSRKGLSRTCINLLLVFFVSGLWHGAAWTFIVWGILHGFASVIERVFNKYILKIPYYLRVTMVFLFVNTTWVLFRATSWDSALYILKEMFIPTNNGIESFRLLFSFYYLIFVLILLVIVFKFKTAIERAFDFNYDKKSLILIVVTFCLSVLCLTRVSTFIYFNF